MSKKTHDNAIGQNRKAGHEYFIEERFEAGLVLEGWEVKSLRLGKIQLTDSYILVKNDEVWWMGGLIPPVQTVSTHEPSDPQRTRKLLLHQREIRKLIGATAREGYTIVPVRLYWSKGKAKLEIALAKGKKLHDKRATQKDRDWSRDKQRIAKINL